MKSISSASNKNLRYIEEAPGVRQLVADMEKRFMTNGLKMHMYWV